jgi:hypothetical protein
MSVRGRMGRNIPPARMLARLLIAEHTKQRMLTDVTTYTDTLK